MPNRSIKLGDLWVETSTRGTTGLNGVSYSPAFTKSVKANKDLPYIAFTNRENAERLDPRLDRESYPYGGQPFHIGVFNSPGKAAYARAYFLKNTKELVDWWESNGGPSRTIKMFTSYPWDFPNLAPVDDDETILSGIRAADLAYKKGGSDENASRAAEKARIQAEQNLAHIASAQKRNKAEDSAASVIATSPELQNTLRILKNKGASQADMMDDISAYLEQGMAPADIAKQLEADYLEEQQRLENEKILLEDIKRLTAYLKNR